MVECAMLYGKLRYTQMARNPGSFAIETLSDSQLVWYHTYDDSPVREQGPPYAKLADAS